MYHFRIAAARWGAGMAAIALVGAVGCAADTRVRDGGRAPAVTPPISASPLWPGYTPPQVPGDAKSSPVAEPYAPVRKVTVPAGGLRAVDVPLLLQSDPNVSGLVREAAAGGCAGGRCTVRDPVYRDLTGDGREELVVAVDDLVFRLTVLAVYRASGHRVRPVLVLYVQLGSTAETFGRDLVVNAVGGDGLITTRYRWNGTVMVPVAPGRDAQDHEETPTS
ncbi:hypothetical protein ACZ90_00190 [Streptomyces albus subsp. albus]|nr:hypothetical protein ACZ90_00190 [Streptomyces albus subsp. albus]